MSRKELDNWKTEHECVHQDQEGKQNLGVVNLKKQYMYKKICTNYKLQKTKEVNSTVYKRKLQNLIFVQIREK